MGALIYKICSRSEWDAARAAGVYRGSEVDRRDGFIHFSTAAQVEETHRRYFAGRSDLVQVGVDPAVLGPALRFEASRGGVLFPHLYAELPVGLAQEVCELDLVRGEPELPSSSDGEVRGEPELPSSSDGEGSRGAGAPLELRR
jgi:uncharacterized protein (DUF952 family)